MAEVVGSMRMRNLGHAIAFLAVERLGRWCHGLVRRNDGRA
jgi:hypothetical protein